jgi:cytosolic carboxypeptidase protein 2/3
MNPTIGAE